MRIIDKRIKLEFSKKKNVYVYLSNCFSLGSIYFMIAQNCHAKATNSLFLYFMSHRQMIVLKMIVNVFLDNARDSIA